MNVRERLYNEAMTKGLRQSTVLSYERLLGRMGLLDRDVDQLPQEDVLTALWTIDNPNTRRAAVIAVRSVLGLNIKIPKGVPRRYDLPTEDTLRLALMTSPHEARGLLMMYAGLRIGEACAVTAKDLDGDRLTVDKQVVQLHKKGQPTICRIADVKGAVDSVIVPWALVPVINSLSSTAKPDGVRESLRRAGDKVGVSLNPHMLRHWYATTMIARGVDLTVVQKQMRHSDIATTLRTYVQTNTAVSIHDTFG